MGRESPVTREARERIKEQIRERGIAEVDVVVSFIERYYSFDESAARQREIRAYARRLLGSIKDEQGERSMFAVKGSPGIYIDFDNCKDICAVQHAVEQLKDKRDGLSSRINKGASRIRELEGQATFFYERVAGEANTTSILH